MRGEVGAFSGGPAPAKRSLTSMAGEVQRRRINEYDRLIFGWDATQFVAMALINFFSSASGSFDS